MAEALAGKVALVTGAGSGLGAATARALAAAGCGVSCVDVNGDAAERTRDALPGASPRHLALGCDVANARAVVEAVDAVVTSQGRLDIVVSCAAIDHTRSLEEMSIAQWDEVIAVNLRGPFLMCKAACPAMKTHGGHIVNIASTAATRAWANASAYHASKWGLVGFGRALGVEGRPFGIRVTTVIPGGMKTHFFDRFKGQGIPMPDERNLQDPAVVADTIVYAVAMPAGSALQEVIVTPVTETSWP